MKKIKTIFKRNWNTKLVINEINPECEWVFNGEGIATRKYDGTCVKIEGDKYYKRRQSHNRKPLPANFIEEEYDPITEKRVGWIEVDFKKDKYHVEAYNHRKENNLLFDGTYELIGPKIQGNPEKFRRHILIKHRGETKIYDNISRSFDQLKKLLKDKDIEGIVFQHEDGRMAKIKKLDFGFNR